MKFRTVIAGAAPSAIAAVVGSIASKDAKEVYENLKKPAWAPPAEVFGPVWSSLYTLIGYSGARMKRVGVSRKLWALHYVQLGLNAGWSWAFFKEKNKTASLLVITALNVSLTLELISLWQRDRKAALALMPYAAWVAFAAALNLSVDELDTA